MKNLFLIFSFLAFQLFSFSSFAAQTNTTTSAIIYVTNSAGTFNSNNFKVFFNGDAAGYGYSFTNASNTGFHFISTNNTAEKVATNIYRKLTNDWAGRLTISFNSATSIKLLTALNGKLALTNSLGWATNNVTTNLLENNTTLTASNFNGTFTGDGSALLTNATGTNILYVSKGGNNTTAQPNRLDKPYLTLTAAQAAWTSGSTIQVLPGTYNEALTNVQPDGIRWFFNEGADIYYTGTNGYIFKITNGNVYITGAATINSHATSMDVVYNILIEGGALNLQCREVIAVSGNAVGQSGGTVIAKISGDCSSRDGNSYGYLWTGGNGDMACNKLEGYWGFNANVAGTNAYTFNISCSEISPVDFGSNQNAAIWIKSASKVFNCSLTGLSKWYFQNVGKFFPITGGGMAINLGVGSYVQINGQKISAGLSSSISMEAPRFADIHIQNTEDLLNSAESVVHIVGQDNGSTPFTNFIHVEIDNLVAGTNANGITLENMDVGTGGVVEFAGRINTRASVGFPIFGITDLVTSEITLRNADLAANFAVISGDVVHDGIYRIVDSGTVLDGNIRFTDGLAYVYGDGSAGFANSLIQFSNDGSIQASNFFGSGNGLTNLAPNAFAAGAIFDGEVQANIFTSPAGGFVGPHIGDGQSLTNITATNIVGTLTNAIATQVTNTLTFTAVSALTNTLGFDATASLSAGTAVVIKDRNGNTIDTVGTVATLHVLIPLRANMRLTGTGITCVIY